MPNDYVRDLNAHQKPHEIVGSLNAVSLFSGGGGFDLGLTWAGFSVRYATDFDTTLCDTLRSHFPHGTVETADVRDLSGYEISSTIDGNVDLLIGGPPCQSFSLLGKRGGIADERGSLVQEYLRLLREIKPRAFVFENVVGILSADEGKTWRNLISEIEESGYRVHHAVLNAVNYGVPQIRKRVILVGFSDPSIRYTLPASSHKQHITVRQALEGVVDLPNHRIRPHSVRVVDRYASVMPGSRDPVSFADRLHPDKPSGTVVIGSSSGGAKPFIHPFEPRHITAREAARLQSFPDWYVFAGTDTKSYKAVGNAVPPLMAKAIGQSVKDALTNA